MILLTMIGCVTTMVDRFTVDRIVREGMMVPDTKEACALGESFSHVLMALRSDKKTPDLAMVIADTTSAMCAEQQLWEAELRGLRGEYHLRNGETSWMSEVKDARIEAERLHTLSAMRFYDAFLHTENVFGPIGEDCPEIKEEDEAVYLVGLVAGMLAVLHDRSGGGEIGVPLDVLPRVSRSAVCLDNDAWWDVPNALQSGVWASVPGSGPADVDPWQLVQAAAEQGGSSGVRVAWGLVSLLAGNAGQEEVLYNSIIKHGESITQVEQNPKWALLDQYAYEISRHQSDIVWMTQKGHRTPTFGQLPEEPQEILMEEEDPFGAEDPFGDE